LPPPARRPRRPAPPPTRRARTPNPRQAAGAAARAARSRAPGLAAAEPAAGRRAPGAETTLAASISRYFESHVGCRLYIQVDKPLYKPGETIWFKTWDLQARTLGSRTPTGADAKKAYGAGDTGSATVEVRRPTGEPLAGKALSAAAA